MAEMQMFSTEERTMKALLETGMRYVPNKTGSLETAQKMVANGWLRPVAGFPDDQPRFTPTAEGQAAFERCQADFRLRMAEMGAATEKRAAAEFTASVREHVVNDVDCRIGELLIGSLDELPRWGQAYIQHLRGQLFDAVNGQK